MRIGFAAISIAMALAGCQTNEQVGRSDYAALCAGCHGDTGRGDGPAAAGLPIAPPDLTTLSARNGGEFPMVEVMSTIDGYSRGDHYGAMPKFWPRLEGELVMVETEPGVMTPTPRRLVALAEYLRTIQQ
ncbi:c-type cytochrome [Pseudaestuariivita rosea]|uniref:c-type cytochrome n=1 Tax=Pseudaestuariivita rosea TaxID=2763263 RepID=UPI001ABA22A9|nr:c-type cytochrome [Pseudaestuariivita rosea]